MSQFSKPCCDNISFELVDAPRTEGAIPSPDIIRCASCGSTMLLPEALAGRRFHISAFFQSLAGRIVQNA